MLAGRVMLRNLTCRKQTETLSPAWFARYCDVVLVLEDVLHAIAAWGEDCPCHGKFLKHYRSRRVTRSSRRRCFYRQDIFSAFVGDKRGCPMGGKQAPELAVGKLEELMAGFGSCITPPL